MAKSSRHRVHSTCADSSFIVCTFVNNLRTLYTECNTNCKLLFSGEGRRSERSLQRDRMYLVYIGDVLRISYGPIRVLAPGGRTPVWLR